MTGGAHSFPGGFRDPGAVWLLSAHPPSPLFPIPLPAVARCFGSLGLTCVGSQSHPARLPLAPLSQGSLILAQRHSVCTQGIFILLLLPVSC